MMRAYFKFSHSLLLTLCLLGNTTCYAIPVTDILHQLDIKKQISDETKRFTKSTNNSKVHENSKISTTQTNIDEQNNTTVNLVERISNALATSSNDRLAAEIEPIDTCDTYAAGKQLEDLICDSIENTDKNLSNYSQDLLNNSTLSIEPYKLDDKSKITPQATQVITPSTPTRKKAVILQKNAYLATIQDHLTQAKNTEEVTSILSELIDESFSANEIDNSTSLNRSQLFRKMLVNNVIKAKTQLLNYQRELATEELHSLRLLKSINAT